MTTTSTTAAENGRPDLASRFGIPAGKDADRFNASAAPARTLGVGLTFDFTEPAREPDYLVHGLWEYGSSNLVSATKSAGKSFAMLDLCVVVATGGGHWLGREVKGGRVLYIDEENAESRLERRWKAVARVRGFDNTHRGNLRYLLKQGVRLDSEGVLDALEAEITDQGATLVVIDTTTSATNADLNDNRQAANVARELRAIADRLGVVIVTLHHRRKGQQGFGPDDPDVAAMGAAAWTNQVDAHSTWAWRDATEEDHEPQEGDPFPEPTGRWRLRTEFDWVPDHNMRDGGSATPERVVFESVKDATGRPLWVRIWGEGKVEKRETKESVLTTRIGHAVWNGAPDGAELRTGQIAELVGEDAQDRTFKNALRASVTAGHIAHVTKPDGSEKRGYYRRGETEPEPAV